MIKIKLKNIFVKKYLIGIKIKLSLLASSQRAPPVKIKFQCMPQQFLSLSPTF